MEKEKENIKYNILSKSKLLKEYTINILFEKGKQYNVQFKVYNNQEIKLSIGLTAWEEDNNDILGDSEEE